jgi:hypothetical protein
MSQYGTIYRLQWNTVASIVSATFTMPAQAMVVNIYDTENIIPDVDTPVVISLLAAANPLVISIINNDQDKFSPIRAKQAVITFESDINDFQDITTFADSSDNRWYVEATADGQAIFKGFLMLVDSQMDFLPDPNVVVLTASDHLATLKDIALTTDSGINPSGKYKIGELIGLCLKKTGMSLPITVINNLRHGSSSMSFIGAVFIAATKQIGFTPGTEGFFYVGQVVTVTGTVFNDGTYNVTVVTDVSITVAETLVNEAVNATFTDSSSGGHFYDKIYLDAKTFESSIGLSENCYTVLEKILGEDCFMTQWKGNWYVMRVDEFDGNPIYAATFDFNGLFVSFDTPVTFAKSIGATETRRFANADALLRFDRPHKFVKETYNYRYPEEIPCNRDFARGTGAQPTGAATETIEQTLECWQFLREGTTPAGLDSAPFAGSYGVLRKMFEYNYEVSRFAAEIEAGGFRHYFKSEGIEVQQGDKIELGYDYKLSTTETPTNMFTAHVRLVGDDGFVYDWNYSETTGISFWHKKTTAATVFDDMFQNDWSGANTLEYHSMQATSLPLPVSGTLYIRLVVGTVGFELNFANVTLNIIAFINGSYQRYLGQYEQVTRLNSGSFNYNANRDKEVFISDAPRKQFKGAMFYYTGSVYVLTSRWYTSAPFALGPPPDTTYLHPYGYIQAYSVWNQYRNANRILSSSVLALGSTWNDSLDKLSLTDNNMNTNNRYFMLISFEQNWKTALWSGIFIEDYRTDIGKIYDDTHEFAYKTE